MTTNTKYGKYIIQKILIYSRILLMIQGFTKHSTRIPRKYSRKANIILRKYILIFPKIKPLFFHISDDIIHSCSIEYNQTGI